MKFLKKLTLFLILAISVFSMTACSASSNLAINGYLWFKNPSSFTPNWTETSVYDITFTNVTPSKSDAVGTEGYSLNITSGTFTTTLKSFTNTENGNYYVYTTEFNLVGEYVVPNPAETGYDKVEESYQTVTEFKDDLTPIRSEKHYESQFSNYKYDYVLTYAGNTATAKLTESSINGEGKNEQTFTFEKYNKKAYIDNDILLLAHRLFNVNSSFVRQFRTVDVLSNKLHDMQSYAYLVDKELDVKKLPNYTLNGVNLALTEETVSCAHVEISIDDKFAGAPLECYYAQDRETHRHRLIETYLPFGSIGYLKLHLASVEVTE